MISTQRLTSVDAFDTPAPPVVNDAAPGRERAIWISVVILALVYVILFFSGTRFFVLKTAVLPIILAYGLVVRNRVAFMMDWLPLLSAIVLFDAIRGAIYAVIQRGYHTYYLEYVIKLEQAVFGTPALTLPLQDAVRSPALDLASVFTHASHFVFFLFFGLVLWQIRREHFWLYRRSLILLMLFGLMGYAVIPTVPPWLAARPHFAEVPPLAHISETIYTDYIPELYGTFSTNPVAAMPSLHVAFPLICAVVGWLAYGRVVGMILSLYSLFVMFAVIYLGEHYGVDVIAGAIVAGLAVVTARRLEAPTLSFAATIAVSILGIALTAAIVIGSRALPMATF